MHRRHPSQVVRKGVRRTRIIGASSLRKPARLHNRDKPSGNRQPFSQRAEKLAYFRPLSATDQPLPGCARVRGVGIFTTLSHLAHAAPRYPDLDQIRLSLLCHLPSRGRNQVFTREVVVPRVPGKIGFIQVARICLSGSGGRLACHFWRRSFADSRFPVERGPPAFGPFDVVYDNSSTIDG